MTNADSPRTAPQPVDLPRAGLPPVGLGLASVVLGGIGMLLFILPVLGVPLCLLAIALGLAGCIAAIWGRPSNLRLAIAGVVLSSMALGVDLAIAWAPAGFLPNPAARAVVEPVPGRPYVPPPASVDP